MEPTFRTKGEMGITMDNKDLLKQYVDTGLQLPEYQVSNLTDNLKKTYIRKRLISIISNPNGELSDYEYELLTPEQQMDYRQYVMKRVENGYGISDEQFKMLTPEKQKEYVMKRMEIGKLISDYKFKLLTPEQRFQYAMKMVEIGGGISDEQYELLTPEQRFEYAVKRVEIGGGISDYKFKLLTPEQQVAFKDMGGKTL